MSCETERQNQRLSHEIQRFDSVRRSQGHRRLNPNFFSLDLFSRLLSDPKHDWAQWATMTHENVLKAARPKPEKEGPKRIPNWPLNIMINDEN